jgi:hypothetical protein
MAVFQQDSHTHNSLAVRQTMFLVAGASDLFNVQVLPPYIRQAHQRPSCSKTVTRMILLSSDSHTNDCLTVIQPMLSLASAPDLLDWQVLPYKTVTPMTVSTGQSR